jgi:SNF2 family DNA or RNA helicase
MRRRENNSHEPKGGILADQMGLGKTVMMLANIVNGRPDPKKKQRATLIVAAPALVSQWRSEV